MSLDKNQVLKEAQSMFLNDANRKEVLNFLALNGITGLDAENKASEAYKNIQSQRKELLKERNKTETKKIRKEGLKSVYAGLSILFFKIVFIGIFSLPFTLFAFFLIIRGVYKYGEANKQG